MPEADVIRCVAWRMDDLELIVARVDERRRASGDQPCDVAATRERAGIEDRDGDRGEGRLLQLHGAGFLSEVTRRLKPALYDRLASNVSLLVVHTL